MPERSVNGGSSRFGRVPVPIVLVLLVLLPIGPVGWLWGRADAKPRPRPASTLAQIAARAGWRLADSNAAGDPSPPVPGRLRGRARTGAGSYAGRAQPTEEA